jgi:hypothetical protein
MDGAIGNTIYNLEARLHRGETPAEAIAHGLFIRMTAEPETPAATGKSSEQLSWEIEQATGVRISSGE